MQELSAEEIRGAATAANLRRAFGTPVAGPLPAAFLALLSRLGDRDAARPSLCSGAPRPEA